MRFDLNVVDGVFLVLPVTQHAPYAVAAAQRGLHIISEKPMAPSVAACQQMIDAARTSGVMLAVAHEKGWEIFHESTNVIELTELALAKT
jgi:predicted dehydrogenase